MPSVAFLGLGLMGIPMAANLVRDGHDVVVWNRTRSKAVSFSEEHGVEVADSPRAAATGRDVVITMLTDDEALLAAYRGPDGVLQGISHGSVAIDMSTVSPRTARELAGDLRAKGVVLIDAPVSGSVGAATAGSLTVMVGGPEDVVGSMRALLSGLGDTIVRVGETGSGATMKLALNSIVHSFNGAVSESIVLAEKAGIDRRIAYEVMLNSAIAAPFLTYRQPSFETPELAPVMFRLVLAQKDLRLALELAHDVGASMPQTQTNFEVLASAARTGLGEADESAVAQFLRG